MGRNTATVWTLFHVIQFSLLTQCATAVMRRKFYPQWTTTRDVEVVHWHAPQSHASAKYCVEPCSSMVLEASTKCHSCILAHPLIPQYMEMVEWQLVSDVLIALAYFSIPVELLFFIYKAQVFPYKWVVAEFGAFIVLCGLTHMINVWTYQERAANAIRTMTFFKVATAAVSCATAVTLSWVIPDILSVKKREIYLVGKTLKLDNCNIWMRSEVGDSYKLTHELEEKSATYTVPHAEIPRTDSGVQHVLSQHGALLVPSNSLLGRHNCPETEVVNWVDRVVAVKLPYVSTSNFEEAKDMDLANGHIDTGKASNALLVLVLPCDPDRTWQTDDLDVVTAVAGQVAVALSHATVLEESMKSRDQLLEQNTALQIARMEAEEAVAARNDFLAVMNHEMRTPMHSLIALTSILLKTELSDDQRAMIETMSKSSGLLSSLINDILDFSRLETGGLALDITVFKLPDLFREVENIVRPLASSKKVGLIFQLPPDLAKNVMGDSNRILQIMLNVIGNAIKFTLEGEVRVSVYMGDKSPPYQVAGSPHQILTPKTPIEFRYLHVDVVDTGIGIKAMDVPKLFNKFVQADSSTTRHFGGTGLGLVISRKFVELMDGKVWLESKGLGKGTACKMYISLGMAENMKRSRTSPREDSAVAPNFKDLKVMVVDDNPINRIVTRRLLDTIGCIPTVLESGQQCLDVLEKKGISEFQVILLDLCMPEMDGFTVAAEILKKCGSRRRPVISALTANSDTKTRERCYEVGMDHVLMKPINLELLKSELVKLVEIHEELATSPHSSALSSSMDSDAGSNPDSSADYPPAPQLHLPLRSDLHHNNKENAGVTDVAAGGVGTRAPE